METSDYQTIRQLLDDYLRMYSTRDDRLTTLFSDDFSGFTGGGGFLVKRQEEWVAITRQDFAQVREPIRIELKDLALQSLAETVAVATSFFTIHLPIQDHILSRETARLVLIFRKETTGWKISHSSISIPYSLVSPGEVYPLKALADRNQVLEERVAERTTQLSQTNAQLQAANEALATEILEHQQAKAALQRSEELYRSILNASPDDITITDCEGRIQLVSPMASKIFGVECPQEFLGTSILRFIVSEDRARAQSQLSLKRRGNITGPTEYRGLRPDGSVFDIEVNSEFIKDATGTPTGTVLIVRDISERKRVKAEQEKLESQNRQLQKSESLGRMAGAIAHHFNNQLQAVMMSLELARHGLPQDTESTDYLEEAMLSVRKAAEVSGLMLTYLGQVPSEQEPLDVAQVCRAFLPILGASMPQSAAVQTDLPNPGPTARANANQIQQVLTNLITNAWEACGSGPVVIRLAVKTMAAAEIPVTRRFPIDWIPRDDVFVCLEVSDEGSGISDQDLERIFDPFFTTKFAGRGLGLPVVLGIVRAHRGVITVANQSGPGSVFRFFLPLSLEAIIPQPDQAKVLPNATPDASVLLVEDEPVVRQAISRALKHLGFRVLATVDGVEALEVFRRQPSTINCVLCDLTMPRLDGWGTLATLRQLAPGIPVILASGYSEAQVLEGHHGELPNAFLRKPYKLNELRHTLAHVLASAPELPGAVPPLP